MNSLLVCFKANLDDGYALIRPLGVNSSALNGFVMEQNKIYEAVDGDILEIIHNKYFHEVIFESNDSKKDRKRTLSKTVESNEEEEDKSVPEAKIIKLDQKPLTPTIEETWEEFDNGKLFVLTTKGVKGSSKVCLFFFYKFIDIQKTKSVYFVDRQLRHRWNSNNNKIRKSFPKRYQ